MAVNKQKPVDNISIKFRGLKKTCCNVKAALPGAFSDVLSGLCINNGKILRAFFFFFLRALEGKCPKRWLPWFKRFHFWVNVNHPLLCTWSVVSIPLESLLAFLAQLLSQDKSHTQNLHWVCVCLRLGENFTWCLAISDTDFLTVFTHVTSPFLTAGPVFAPPSRPPPAQWLWHFLVLLRPPLGAKLPSWVFSPRSSAPSSFRSLQLWAEDHRPGDFQRHPSSHTRHTYACPRVHTQWIFSFNEAICPVNLAPFPLFYTEGHEHVKIRRLFSKSHSHLRVKAGTLIPSLNQSFQRLKIFPLSYGIIWAQNGGFVKSKWEKVSR